jgi:GNAT superfamily N-acetyltransferase
MHLWGMYVRPAYRRTGCGSALVDAAIEHARSVEGVAAIALGVTTAASAARALYERKGFVAWGVDRGALRIGDVAVDETGMLLQLREST